jgi:hypothetical protein
MPADLQRRTGKLAFVASNLGPFALCGIDNTSRIREERGARLFTVEEIEIEPLPDHNPDKGMARHRPATSYGDRIITAETR